MTVTTKKAKIDPNSQKETDALDTTSDLYRKLSDYERIEKNQTEQKKNRIAREIDQMGEHYLTEIDMKNEVKENERMDMVDFIINKTEQNLVKSKDLYDMPYEDVKNIYVKAQDYNKSWGRIFLEFLMGW